MWDQNSTVLLDDNDDDDLDESVSLASGIL